MTRRDFISHTTLGAAALATGTLPGCQVLAAHELAQIPGALLGPNHAAGHRLRESLRGTVNWPDPTEVLTTDVLIVGGGVAGLSARRWLHQRGVRDVLLLEMEARAGGNALSGKNDASAYAWGAHYLPIADPTDTALVDFLVESKLITGFNNGLPIYDEYALCHDQEERLFINGRWQEGLVPKEGVPAADKAQIDRFLAETDRLRDAIGSDGKPAFAIPLDRSSQDDTYRQLDQLTFAQWLDREGYTSPYLRWYVAYCCRDDYGSLPEQTSAWAGLHYFAARRGKAANADASAVLTWPEGNTYLIEKLREQAPSPIRPHTLVYALERTHDSVVARTYDTKTHRTARIDARQVILAVPQFIAARLLGDSLSTLAPERTALADQIRYAPWLVANLTLDGLPETKGTPLSWDNVLYNTDSVGYVVANHQHLTNDPQRVLTYYRPLCQDDSAEARRLAYQTTRDEWLAQALAELSIPHPDLIRYVRRADVWVWGHGMVSPTRGYVWGEARRALAEPIAGCIRCAHSDLSGISIFEEAFHQGIRVAEVVADGLDEEG